MTTTLTTKLHWETWNLVFPDHDLTQGPIHAGRRASGKRQMEKRNLLLAIEVFIQDTSTIKGFSEKLVSKPASIFYAKCSHVFKAVRLWGWSCPPLTTNLCLQALEVSSVLKAVCLDLDTKATEEKSAAFVTSGSDSCPCFFVATRSRLKKAKTEPGFWPRGHS